MQKAVSINVASRLRELRLARNFTQEQLARKARLCRPTISEIERGASTWPRLHTLKALSRALQVSIFDLVGEQ